MRRPAYGRSVLRGILLIWKKMTTHFDMGYIPSTWTPQGPEGREESPEMARGLLRLGRMERGRQDRKGRGGGEIIPGRGGGCRR